MKSGALRSPRPTRPRVLELVYPESDGVPLGETDVHRRIITYLIEALELWFKPHGSVYVSGNLMLYYAEGDTRKCVSPDVFVVKGVPRGERRVYKVWDEGKGPCVVIEASSRDTQTEDLKKKFEFYRDVLRVGEYYVYDPLREYLPTRLRAWVLKGGRYVERRVQSGRIRSRELGLDLVDVEGRLRLIDPVTGWTLPGLEEAEAERVKAEASRIKERTARIEAEASRIKERTARIEAEAARIKEQTGRIEAEAALGQATEEVRHLQEELEKLRRKQQA